MSTTVGYSAADLSGVYWPIETVQSSSATGTQNNLTLNNTTLALVMNGAAPVVTGLTNGRAGRILFVNYVGAGTLVLNQQDTNSTAANRIAVPDATNNITIIPNGWIALIYNSSRWNAIVVPDRTLAQTVSAVWTFTAGITMNDAVLASPEIKDYAETVNALGTGTGATTINYSLGNVVTLNNTGARTIAFSNLPASGKCGSITIIITAGASASSSWTWPAGWHWTNGGTAPTLTTTNGKIDVVTGITVDNGTSFLGFVGGQNT